MWGYTLPVTPSCKLQECHWQILNLVKESLSWYKIKDKEGMKWWLSKWQGHYTNEDTYMVILIFSTFYPFRIIDFAMCHDISRIQISILLYACIVTSEGPSIKPHMPSLSYELFSCLGNFNYLIWWTLHVVMVFSCTVFHFCGNLCSYYCWFFNLKCPYSCYFIFL